MTGQRETESERDITHHGTGRARDIAAGNRQATTHIQHTQTQTQARPGQARGPTTAA